MYANHHNEHRIPSCCRVRVAVPLDLAAAMTFLRTLFRRKRRAWPLPEHVSQPLKLSLLSVGMSNVNRVKWRRLRRLANEEMDR